MLRNILIGGDIYGHQNIGDEGILKSIVDEVRRRLPDSAYRVLTSDPTTSDWLNVKAYNRRSYLQTVQAFAGANLFICGGGTILSDGPRYALRLTQFASYLRVPTVIFGVGMDPVADPEMRRFIVRECNRVGLILARDKDVQARLLEYGVTTPVEAYADPAMLLAPALDTEVDRLLAQEGIDLSLPSVGFCISGEPHLHAQTPYHELAHYADTLNAEFGLQVVFIPTNYRTDQDNLMISRVMREMKHPERARHLKGEYRPEAIVGLTKRLSWLISSRLHLIIFAASVGVPSIGISRSAKIDSFLSRLHEVPVSGIADFDARQALEFTRDFVSRHQRAQVRERFAQDISQMKDDATALFDRLAQHVASI